MGISSSCLGIESLGLFVDSHHHFVIGNHDTFSFLEPVGKPCQTTFGGKSQDYCKNGKSLCLVRTFIVFLSFLLYHCCLPNNVCLSIFVVLDRPTLEDQHYD